MGRETMHVTLTLYPHFIKYAPDDDNFDAEMLKRVVLWCHKFAIFQIR